MVEEYVIMKNKNTGDDLYGTLSNREREVFQMIAESRSTKDIADILCVSPSTVKTHRANIMRETSNRQPDRPDPDGGSLGDC